MSALAEIIAPRLETPRLILELFDHSPDHYRCLLDSMNNPTAHKDMGDFGVRTNEQFDVFCASARLRGPLFPNGVANDEFYYVLRLRDASSNTSQEQKPELIGGVSLAQRVTGSTVAPPDIGWCVLEDYMGKGYATEAAQKLLDYATQTLGLAQIIAFPLETNPASNRVAEKLGFVPGGKVPDLDNPGFMLNILKLPGTPDVDLSGGLALHLQS